MRHATLAFVILTLAAPACADKDPGATSSDVRADDRRARLARLTRVNAVARLYVGHELTPPELKALTTTNERDVIAALVARPDFGTRFTERLADFQRSNAETRASSSAALPDAPLQDALDGKAYAADRFARFLVQALAPRVAATVLRENAATLATMTYRDLLDVVRRASVAEGGRT